MMINDATAPVFDTPPSNAARPASEDAEDSFLTLMLTQLQNQDPIDPMDNGEFLSQLAAFETASGISELQGSFDEFAAAINAGQSLQTASLVDRDVIADTGTAVLEGGEAVDGRVTLATAADDVTLEITDASGAVVRRMALGATAGTASFTWDGRNDDGRRVDDGRYTIRAAATSGEDTVEVPVALATRVDSVLLGGAGEVRLTLANGQTVPMSAVREIS